MIRSFLDVTRLFQSETSCNLQLLEVGVHLLAVCWGALTTAKGNSVKNTFTVNKLTDQIGIIWDIFPWSRKQTPIIIDISWHEQVPNFLIVDSPSGKTAPPFFGAARHWRLAHALNGFWVLYTVSAQEGGSRGQRIGCLLVEHRLPKMFLIYCSNPKEDRILSRQVSYHSFLQQELTFLSFRGVTIGDSLW